MALGLWRVIHSLGLVLTVLLSALPLRAQSATAVSAGIERYREFTLPNGLRVAIAVDHRVPQVALRIEYAVGDALDPPEQRGIAQLVGAIVPKLQTRHLRAVERPRLLQAAGFKFEEPEVQVNLDTTVVTLQVPAEALELALWLEADRMGFAADGVSQALFEQGLHRAQDLVERAPNDPAALTAFRAALGRAHPYGGLDRPAKLSAVTALAVAERLRRYYNPASAALVLVGDVDVQSAEQAVRRLFGPLPSAPLTPLPLVGRRATPQLISLLSPVPERFSALVWETPALFAVDDQGLDVIATLLSRRLSARNLCDKIRVGQRSRRLTSVFVASCEAPRISSDVWRSALSEELTALAEGRVPAAEVEGAALYYALLASKRADDLLGCAQSIARSVLAGRPAAQAISERIQSYERTDAVQVAAIARRHLLRPADGTVEVTPLASASRGGAAYFGADSEPMFRVPAEAQASMKTLSADWPRPPANGAPHRFQPPTGPTDSLPNGDQLRFIERFGVPVAHANVQIPWPAGALSPAARYALSELLEKSRVDGVTLEEKLGLLGCEFAIFAPVEQLEIRLSAPSSRLASAFEALATVLAQKELPKAAFEAAKENTAGWLARNGDEWSWYWDALGLSAPKSRYAYLSPSARKDSSARLAFAHVARLWQAMAEQPRAIDLVGPFDNQTARALGAMLVRPKLASASVAPVPKRVVFQPGVYLFDRAPASASSATDQPASESVDVCVLWPLPRWVTRGYYPAQLMPWFFRTDTEDGLGARFGEHQVAIPYWQSNSVLGRDQDFLRYSFRVSLERLPSILESLKVHLKRLGEGQFAKRDFENAVAAERQFQVRRSLSGQSMSDALLRAAAHDKSGNEALDIALQIERVTTKDFSELAKTLTLERATIGVIGPAAAVTEHLAALGMKPTSIAKPDTDGTGRPK